MSHTESTRPSSRASCGRTGRSPLIIFKIMNGALESLNGCLPVKVYTGIQTSSELSVASPPAPGVKTDLYDYHAESKHVRFLCDFIGAL